MKVVAHREKMQRLRNRVKKALFYPCVVIVMALIVAYVLLVFVVPQFAELFAGFGAQLPLLTRIIIELSKFLQQFWWLALLCLILPIIGVIFIRRRSEICAKFFDQTILKIPIMGNILKKSIMARLLQTLAITFASGVPLLESLRLSQKVANNAQFHVELGEVYAAVDKGQTLYQSLQMSRLFPNIIVQMVAIGEEAGKLSDMLEKSAEFCQQEVDQLIDRLNQLLEPIVMMVLGIIVGGLVIAMYLPIFKLGMVI
jgi:type IV pilus assembly protein PilC